MKDHLKEYIQNNLEEFNDMNPNSLCVDKIMHSLKTYSPEKKITIFHSIRWVAASLIVMTSAWMIFHSQQDNRKVYTNVLDQKNISHKQHVNLSPIIQKFIENPVKHTPQLHITKNNKKNHALILKLTNYESASERLTAVNAIMQNPTIDHPFIHALVQTMNSDPSSNVRLAALDALSPLFFEPYVKKHLIKSLYTQKDPIVQIYLIELLTKMRAKNINKVLQEITEQDETSQSVKDQAFKSLMTLSL